MAKLTGCYSLILQAKVVSNWSHWSCLIPAIEQDILLFSPSHLALSGSFSSFKSHLHEPFPDLPFECNHCAPFSHSFPSQSFYLISFIFHLPCPFSSLYPQGIEMDTGAQEEGRQGGYCLSRLFFTKVLRIQRQKTLVQRDTQHYVFAFVL